MNLREKFDKNLKKKLTIDEKKLLSLITTVGSGRNSLVFQMPAGLITLEVVWEKIEQTAKEMNVSVSKTAGMFATLEDLDKILGDIEWLWDKWIPKGFVTMLAGDPGIGKSAIVMDFVKTVTTGGYFPLMEEPLQAPQDAVWIDTEASQQILKVRANSMSIPKNRVYIPSIDGDIMMQPDLGNTGHREQIIGLVESIKPGILVLDSLGGSHTKGENKVEDIRPLLEFLALLARDYQLGVIVIHHLNKGNNNESPEVSLYRIRGSTTIPAMCRSIFAVEPSIEKSLKLRMVKTNLARISDAITIVPKLDTAGEFTGFDYSLYIPPAPKRNKKEVVADWVVSTVTEHDGEMKLTELIELGFEHGYSRQNIYMARDVLGDRIQYGGTGNAATWSVARQDTSSINKILGNGKNGAKYEKEEPKKQGRAKTKQTKQAKRN